MPTTKAANYTDEQVLKMKTEYAAAENAKERDAVVESIAAKFGKSKRSIISKMSREEFYIKKVVLSKVTGEKPAKKEDLAVQLREVSGLPMVSAEKLNKTDIQDLIEHFKSYNEVPAEFADVEGDEANQN